MVQADVLELDLLRLDPEARREPALEPDRHVAQPDRPVALVEERLGDDPDRVREVDDPRVVGGTPPDPLREVQHDRHRPERLGEAARARRLLADRAELRRERLVDQPSRLPTDAKLDEHEAGAVDRRVGVAGEGQPPAPAQPIEHPAGQPADDLEALGVDVEQDQLVDRQAIGAARDALDQLGGVRAAAADDRELQAQSDPSEPPRILDIAGCDCL